jgi:hypothetical protein
LNETIRDSAGFVKRRDKLRGGFLNKSLDKRQIQCIRAGVSFSDVLENPWIGGFIKPSQGDHLSQTNSLK